jgi:hypothetical protein
MDTVIELYEDNPEHFEFLLEFIYTNDYDKFATAYFVADNSVRRILTPIGTHEAADKYDLPKTYKHATEDVRDNLTKHYGVTNSRRSRLRFTCTTEQAQALTARWISSSLPWYSVIVRLL